MPSLVKVRQDEEPAEEEEADPEPEPEQEPNEAEEVDSEDPYYDADFSNIEMDEMSDYTAEEKQALKEPLRVADMKEMEESI